MNELTIPQLSIVTICVAVVSAAILFRIYHMGLMYILKSMDWKLDELKDYIVPPNLKKWDQVLQAVVMLAIVWKVSN